MHPPWPSGIALLQDPSGEGMALDHLQDFRIRGIGYISSYAGHDLDGLSPRSRSGGGGFNGFPIGRA